MAQQIILPLALFGAIFAAFYVFVMTRHREKMFLMENELEPEDYGPRLFGSLYQTLKAGIFMISIAIGIMVGYYLDENFILSSEIGYPVSILSCGGLGLIIQFFIEKNAKL